MFNIRQASYVVRKSGGYDHEMEDLVRGKEIIKSSRRNTFWYAIRAKWTPTSNYTDKFCIVKALTYYINAPLIYNVPDKMTQSKPNSVRRVCEP